MSNKQKDIDYVRKLLISVAVRSKQKFKARNLFKPGPGQEGYYRFYNKIKKSYGCLNIPPTDIGPKIIARLYSGPQDVFDNFVKYVYKNRNQRTQLRFSVRRFEPIITLLNPQQSLSKADKLSSYPKISKLTISPKPVPLSRNNPSINTKNKSPYKTSTTTVSNVNSKNKLNMRKRKRDIKKPNQSHTQSHTRAQYQTPKRLPRIQKSTTQINNQFDSYPSMQTRTFNSCRPITPNYNYKSQEHIPIGHRIKTNNANRDFSSTTSDLFPSPFKHSKTASNSTLSDLSVLSTSTTTTEYSITRKDKEIALNLYCHGLRLSHLTKLSDDIIDQLYNKFTDGTHNDEKCDSEKNILVNAFVNAEKSKKDIISLLKTSGADKYLVENGYGQQMMNIIEPPLKKRRLNGHS